MEILSEIINSTRANQQTHRKPTLQGAFKAMEGCAKGNHSWRAATSHIQNYMHSAASPPSYVEYGRKILKNTQWNFKEHFLLHVQKFM
jgi:hypothetical protein